MKSKFFGIDEAIATLLADGDSVVLGAALETAIPFAAAHEMIRQQRKGLHLIAPIADLIGDLLIGAGCINQVSASWVGNVSAGLGHNYRRATEHALPHAIGIHDYSNLALGLALTAGAHGMPFVALKSLLGSDILKSNPHFKIQPDPFSEAGDPVVLVPALKPDLAIFCVQRADEAGNAHLWGSTGVTQEAALAAERVLIIADEIVDPEIIASDPSRVLFPGFRVSAVCELPAASHPAPLTGCWRRDNDFFHDYHAASREADGFQAWLAEWITDMPDHAAYRAKLGARLGKLRITGEAASAPANYAVA